MKLSLPEFDIKLRRNVDGQLQVYDPLRAKYVALTPEEWVRQHFVNFLISNCGYPSHLMANEVGLKHNGTLRRCDTIVYDDFAHPIVIIEYKAPTISINVNVFDQIVRYNMVMNVDWLIVSNGISHYCCHVNHENGTYSFLKNIPSYKELI